MADNTCHFGINSMFADGGVTPGHGEDLTRLYFPADRFQFAACVKRIFKDDGLRFVFSTRSAVPDLLDDAGQPLFAGKAFEPGKDDLVRDAGGGGYIVAFGEIVYRALDAVLRLKEQGVNVGLVNKPTLNVYDEAMMKRLATAPFVLVAEGWNVKTGLGSRFGTELLKRGNGLFGSAEQTGSLGVVTINCARLGYLHAGDERALYARLDELLGWSRDSLEVKRKVIQRLIDQGLFPYTKRWLGTLRNHFSTIGVNGINEMIRNFTRGRDDVTTPWGHAFAVRLLDHLRARIVAFQEQTGHMYNLEATPAEGTTYRFAKEDRKRWPDILQAGASETPYYTNSSQLPVGFTDDPFEALTRQEELQTKYNGGTVLHLYMNVGCRRLPRARRWCAARSSGSACRTSRSRRR
jgi:hypothetical protein